MSSDFTTMPLEDCLDALIDYRGKTPTKTVSGIPLITAKIIKGGRIEAPTEFIAKDDYDRWMRRGLPKPGDVVLTVEAPLGEVAQLGPAKIALAQRVVTLRGKAGVLDNTYLLYLLQTDEVQSQLKARATGTTVLGIKQSELRKVTLSLLPFDLQLGAAATLKALDDRVTLMRETNATLEAIAQALFKSWFVDFDPVRANMEGRAPQGMDETTAALFPTSLQKGDSGMVPAGWKVRKVEDVTQKVGMGPFGSNIKVSTFANEGVPVLNGRHLHSTLFADENFNFITPEHADRLANSCVGAGDIVLTHRGSIGQTSLIPAGAQFDRYVVSQSQFFLRCDEKLLPPEWMIYFFRSPVGQHLLLANASQVGVPSIAKPVTYLRSIPLIVPPPAIAQAFASVVRALHTRMLACQSSAKTLATLRDTLLPRLISGQLRIPEANGLPESTATQA